MRALFKITTLLIITSSSLLAKIDGYYYNPKLRESIRIIEHRNDVIIKGLFSDNRISRFDRIERNTYEDRYGNLLICEDRNTIKLKRWRTRDYIRFDKIDEHRGRNDWYRYHDYDDNCDDRNRHSGYDDRYRDDRYRDNRYRDEKGYNDRYYNDNYRNDNFDRYPKDDKRKNIPDYNNSDYQSRSIDFSNSRLIGTWEGKNRSFGTVAIIDTRDGLKAKFSGTTNWVTYTKSTSRPNEYIDDRGNRYIFDEDNDGKWFPSDKDKKVIELKKISDEVKY
jgi:hypothetical protein